MFITRLKIKIPIKAWQGGTYIFLNLSLIIGQKHTIGSSERKTFYAARESEWENI